MIIYKATNLINGKIYIGQSRISMIERIGDHKRKSFRHGSNSHFHNAIRKHGIDSFLFEQIDTAETIEDLNKKEIYWINRYSCLDRSKGYNLRDGGNKVIFTDCVKKKMSNSHKGKKFTPEQNKAKSILMSGKGNNFYGKRHTQETKDKISKSRKGKGLGQTELQKLNCQKRGSKNGLSKINERQARQIKILLLNGIRNKDIKDSLNISKDIVCNINSGKTWRHIEI